MAPGTFEDKMLDDPSQEPRQKNTRIDPALALGAPINGCRPSQDAERKRVYAYPLTGREP